MTPIIQAIAETLCRAAQGDPELRVDGEPVWREYEPEARAVLKAMVKGATPYMIAVGRQRLYDSPTYEMMADKAAACWAFMCRAGLEEET